MVSILVNLLICISGYKCLYSRQIVRLIFHFIQTPFFIVYFQHLSPPLSSLGYNSPFLNIYSSTSMKVSVKEHMLTYKIWELMPMDTSSSTYHK
jgi:hypothetical protein